jgi:D-glycero-D-manno-heptose 1,7-bisphosphate phosphatase
MKKAVFLDRDGVLNELVLNPVTGEFEPPHSPEDLVLYPGVLESLQVLNNSGFELFLVSNQPDYAKGKTTLENIRAVHGELERILREAGLNFKEYYYCYHHPRGIVPEFSFDCECRKPKPYFLLKAARDYGIDLGNSWMVGDRDSDIGCGKSAGLRTILVENVQSSMYRGSGNPDFKVANLKIAAQIIIHN